MRRILILAVSAFSLCCSLSLWSVDKKEMEKWVGIITEKDPCTKYQKLEDFRTQYGNEKKSQLTPLMYQHLNDSAYGCQKYDKTVEYGEKALTYPEIEDFQKLLILFRMSNATLKLNDLQKAMEYCQKVVDKGNALRVPANAQAMDNDIIAPALRLQAKIIYNEKPSDPTALKAAAKKALEAMSIDKSKDSEVLLRTLANLLIKQGNETDAAPILEEFYKIKPDAEIAKMLGKHYSTKMADDQKAMEYFKASYEMKKTAEVAYCLGILQNKKYTASQTIEDLETAILYFADAFVFNDAKFSPNADKFLQHLFFNILKKEASAEDKEKSFQELLDAAKVRLGLTTTEPVQQIQQ